MLEAIKAINLGLRFVLELAVLFSLGYWGFRTGNTTIVKYTLGIGAPLLAAVVWAMFGSPNASMPLHGSSHLILEIVVFGSGVAALWAAGRLSWAIVLGIIILVNRILMEVWGQ